MIYDMELVVVYVILINFIFGLLYMYVCVYMCMYTYDNIRMITYVHIHRIEVQQLSEGRDRSRTRSGDLAGGDAFEVESLTSMREKVRIMTPSYVCVPFCY